MRLFTFVFNLVIGLYPLAVYGDQPCRVDDFESRAYGMQPGETFTLGERNRNQFRVRYDACVRNLDNGRMFAEVTIRLHDEEYGDLRIADRGRIYKGRRPSDFLRISVCHKDLTLMMISLHERDCTADFLGTAF